jgi:hypothetical protein
MKIKRFLLEHTHAYDWLVAGYALAALLLSKLVGFKLDFSVLFQNGYDKTFLSIVFLYFVIHAAVLALSYRKDGSDAFLFGPAWRRGLRDRFFHWSTFFEIIRVLFLLKVTLTIYCDIKQAIPFINPELHDSDLASIDRVIHFGLNPNTASSAFLGAPAVVFAFDKLYILWYLLKPLVIAYFAVTPDRKSHSSFFTAYFAMWIFGGLLAVLLPSLGPIYTHPEWFADLNPEMARQLQNQLMVHYQAALANPEKYKILI